MHGFNNIDFPLSMADLTTTTAELTTFQCWDTDTALFSKVIDQSIN